jgi:hypothetical protein
MTTSEKRNDHDQIDAEHGERRDERPSGHWTLRVLATSPGEGDVAAAARV